MSNMNKKIRRASIREVQHKLKDSLASLQAACARSAGLSLE